MDSTERAGWALGIIASLTAIVSFAAGIPSPFNYAVLAVTVSSLIFAVTWRYVPRLHLRSKKTERIYDVSTTVVKGGTHFLREDFQEGDLIRVSIAADKIVDCYIFDENNYDRFLTGHNFVPLAKRGHFLSNVFDFSVPSGGCYYFVVRTDEVESVIVRWTIDRTGVSRPQRRRAFSAKESEPVSDSGPIRS